MRISEYQYLCSNEILKLIKSLFNSDDELSSLSDNYSSLFDESSTVNYVWSLVSTSLLMSENLYKYDKAYKLISDDTIKLIEDKLFLYPIVYPDHNVISPCLLDSNNNIADSFLHHIRIDYEDDPLDYYDYEELDNFDKNPYFESDLRIYKIRKEMQKTFEALRVDGAYGCNHSIMEDGYINVRKFIERTRNALAHSNYEVLDENNIRLYHYNRNTKKLDFNVILDASVIVLMVDELNEIASKKYSDFIEIYSSEPDMDLFGGELTDDKLIEYMLSLDVFDEDVAKTILVEAKQRVDFISSINDSNKIVIINKMIYDKIRPSYDTGIIINDYLYCNDEGRIISDELYDKYPIFGYLNSDYYNSVHSNVTDEVYIQNKFKFLLLSLLECSILNGYNINENRDVGIIDFSNMNIDENIMRKFLIKNGLKANAVVEQLEKELVKNKKAIEEKQSLIEKKQTLLTEHNLQNEYFSITLPSQIETLQKEKMELNGNSISAIVEINNAKKQGCLYNFSENMSHFVFNHLRNALAHGYVKFPDNIDLGKPCDTVISFEDYDPNNKKELTFKGEIKFGDLLKTITSEEYVESIFEFPKIRNNISTSKRKK